MLARFDIPAISSVTASSAMAMSGVMESLALEYTSNLRINIRGEQEGDSECELVAPNFCFMCFFFVSTAPFGIHDSARVQRNDVDTIPGVESEDIPAESSQHGDLPASDTASNDMEIDIRSSASAKLSCADQDDERRFCKWSLTQCYRNTDFCIICKEIVRLYETWSSRRYGSLRHLTPDEVQVNAHYSSHDSRLRVVQEYDNVLREFLPRDLSTLSLHTSGISIFGKAQNPDDGIIGPSLLFQPIEGMQCTVDNFVQLNRESEEHLAGQCFKSYSGRLRAQTVNFELLLLWKSICLGSHVSACDPCLIKDLPVPAVRMIDVVNHCLVDVTDDLEYFVLSYVWGQTNNVRLLDSLVASFYTAGVFSTLRLPMTIADAITLTRNLGVRYLWIDSLCIVQDNDADRGYYLSVMDRIYAHAELTIVNATGSHADSGLPGIRAGTRSEMQVPFTRPNGKFLVRCLNPPGDGTQANYTGDNAWSTRAWTLQEHILSRRMLVFTPEQVYWECKLASWREDANWEVVDPPLFREDPSLENIDLRQIQQSSRTRNNPDSAHISKLSEDGNHDTSLSSNHTAKPEEPDSMTFDEAFRRLVQHYSLRDLTFKGDRFHAFAGTLKVLSNTYDYESFFWGLPVGYFVNSLTWMAYYDMTRIQDLHLVQHKMAGNTNNSRIRLPSWSWVGWMCYVPWYELSGSLRPDAFTLQIYVFREDGTLETLAETESIVGSSTVKDSDSADRGWCAWLPDRRETIVTDNDVPDWLARDSQSSTAVSFYTDTAQLVVSKPNTPDGKSQLLLQASDSSRHDLGDITRVDNIYHDPSVSSGDTVHLTGLLIDRAAVWHDNIPRLLIMLVEMSNGVAYKRGMVAVKETEWAAMKSREWKVAVLC